MAPCSMFNPVRVLQICLSLDALAAQIGFQFVVCITLNATLNVNIKTGDRNARIIYTAFK